LWRRPEGPHYGLRQSPRRNAVAVPTNWAAWSQNTGPWPPFGTTVFVTPPHALHLGIADHRFRKLPLNRTRLFRKIRRRADDDHGVDRRRLGRGHVPQRDAAAAQADRFDARKIEMMKEREHIVGPLNEHENRSCSGGVFDETLHIMYKYPLWIVKSTVAR
jgi:hypothetical protein